ncbi:MAG: DUF6285 domain-containing protein [Pseudomonadota bacterium]|nr:DUF6285 domain-containing protein [Pseudomonadota bacterium]
MERNSPTAKDLLETAISLLRNQVLPNTPTSQKLNLLMISSAMAIAARELNGSIELEVTTISNLKRLYPNEMRADFAELKSILSSDIRSGKFDDSDAVYSVLVENTRRRLEISNPRHLKYSESK